MKETKASTQQHIIINNTLINTFIDGMLEIYDYQRDDDYWASVKLPDESHVDVNISVYNDGFTEWILATAYPVNGNGDIQTQYGCTLRQIPIGGEQ